MFQVPSYNRSIKYSLDEFKDHPMQDLMALFIAKNQEEITSSLKSTTRFNYEDVFFLAFYRFIYPYINLETFSTDTMIYFQSSSEQSAGTQVACAGTGKKSCSYGNGFRKANKSTSKKDSPATIYFEEKYDTSIRGEKDQRVFLDEPHIWNKLATDKYVMPEKWRSIANSGYTDATLTESIPHILYKHLVPLAIRNKVVQKHRHIIRGSTPLSKITVTCDDTTEDETEDEEEMKQTVAVKPAFDLSVFADIQKAVEEEGW